MDAHNLTIGCCNQISMVQLLYSSSPIGTIIEQNLNMAPVIYFCVLNIFQNMFLPPLHFCNEPKKTDKHNLNSYEDLLMFHFFTASFSTLADATACSMVPWWLLSCHYRG
jgi:hypothetical protein